MPISKYNKAFGGKPGSAAKAKSAMADEYGPDKGERVFYATMNKRMKSHMPKGVSDSPKGDIGEKRGMEADKVAHFKRDGKVMKAASYFGSIKPRASKEGNNPS